MEFPHPPASRASSRPVISYYGIKDAAALREALEIRDRDGLHGRAVSDFAPTWTVLLEKGAQKAASWA